MTGSPERFYTGLVAELYEPLLGEVARADDYTRLLDRFGTPALELACGSGLPLVELVARGYEVHGLDSSPDMLARCRARARERGVKVTLHEGVMQDFSLPGRYRSVFLAGGSFTLLASDADAEGSLRCIRAHLEPGGAALIPIEIPRRDLLRASLGHFREAEGPEGARLRVGAVALEEGDDGRSLRLRLRYERIARGGERERVERDWVRRWWPQDSFAAMLRAAGFRDVRLLAPEGGPAPEDADVFVALALRP